MTPSPLTPHSSGSDPSRLTPHPSRSDASRSDASRSDTSRLTPHPSRILVTGCAGFIGSHLVDRLLAEGFRVVGVDNFDPFYDPAMKRRNLADVLQHPSFTLIEADIRDLPSLKVALSPHTSRLTPHMPHTRHASRLTPHPSHSTPHPSRLTPHCIVHLAARAGVRPSLEDPVGYYDANVRGTQNLLELAREWGVKQFVFGSSSSVYGVNPNVPWREDDHVLLPISPYAGSKVAGELLGHVYSHLYRIRFIALRFFTVYGPRQRPDLAIHKFARLMQAGKPIPLYGDGTSRRDYTYVDDVVEGIRRAMDYTGYGYEIINLGNNNTVGLLEMIQALERALGVKAELDPQPPQPGDVPQTWADITKARQLLDWQPETPFAEGLQHFAHWLTSK